MPIPVSVTENTPVPSGSMRQPSVIVPAGRRVADRVRHEVAEGARELVAAAGDDRGVADVELHLRAGRATAPSRRTRRAAAAARSRTARPSAGSARSRAPTASAGPRTSRCMLADCSCMSCRKRSRCRSSRSSSCSVSMNPLITVSGVLSSCETLAMKSRRIRATASSCVTSRAIRSFSATPNGTIWIASVAAGIALRIDDDRIAVVAGLEVADELGLPHEVHERRADVVRRGRARAADWARALAHLMRLAGIQHDHAVGDRLGGALEALDRVREVALVGAARCARGDTGPTTRRCHGPRAFGNVRVERRSPPMRVRRSRWTTCRTRIAPQPAASARTNAQPAPGTSHRPRRGRARSPAGAAAAVQDQRAGAAHAAGSRPHRGAARR